MTEKVNAYFAVLLITIAGSAASLLIIHVANSNAAMVIANDPVYAQLK
jgi:hypothetical protein